MLLKLLAVASLCIVVASAKPQGGNNLSTMRADEKLEKVGELAHLIGAIKKHIKEALKEVISQIFRNVLEILDEMRRKFLRKIGTMTMADIFNKIFGGVSDIILIKPGLAFDKPSHKPVGVNQFYPSEHHLQDYNSGDDDLNFLDIFKQGDTITRLNRALQIDIN